MAQNQGSYDYSSHSEEQPNVGTDQFHMMTEANIVYLITTVAFAILWIFLWFESSISITKMTLSLFSFDMVMTAEAGLYSNILLIALLHVITLPAFFSLIYLDLIGQHKSTYSCFICGKGIYTSELTRTLSRTVNGRHRSVLAHAGCVYLESENRKAFARSRFRKGIPQ